jgi:hypothetical protein
MISKFKASEGRADLIGCREAGSHPSEGSPKRTDAQGSKPNNTMLSPQGDGENDDKRKPSDPSASTRKRGRSSHSSPKPKISTSEVTKGSSDNTKASRQGTRSKVSNSTLRSFVTDKLSEYMSKDGRYNGLIRILSDPAFLQFCYMLIKGKPGNMSKGITKETLDGISFQ